ncbi:uncharacterized protein AB675_8997 [Cyphellophora attinorum]|uniref:Heme peroxidase n=1 Tax=Cyphellophora attinorum TaxID=1664694 RepID=A0A0N1H6N3_9EURO|nr:uncharacterized protein AB675_8997 [Phialophora attinorum]KPI41770.1 hypothetical protein AB675_8997 [Phialophora attinorum]
MASNHEHSSVEANGDAKAQHRMSIKYDATRVQYGCHSRPLRGLMSTPKSVTFEGRFGRMFPHCLSPASFGTTDTASRQALEVLAIKMVPPEGDPPKDGADSEESAIPALYTYLGQFVDHDITFDPVTTFQCHFDPDGLTDFRTPALDLDNLYGRGPSDQPYLYDFEGSKGTKFLLGEHIKNKFDKKQRDLQRNAQGRALIGDPRNDENSIISQFHAVMLRFHNKVVDKNPHLDNSAGFPELQRIVRWHYQWVVVHDFLERIIQPKVLEGLKTGDFYDKSKLKFYKPKHQAFMPVEYSAAAYRLGHSMVRPGYRMNDDDALPFSIFPDLSDTSPDSNFGLTGFRKIEADRAIDWARFIDIELRPAGKAEANEAERKKRLQLAYRIDVSVVKPLSTLPKVVAEDSPNPSRTATSCAATSSVSPAARPSRVQWDDAIPTEAEPNPKNKLKSISEIPELAIFKDNTPLWTYILAEAALYTKENPVATSDKGIVNVRSPKLGHVGGRIVAETILGMLFADKSSFLYANPTWTPTITERALPGTEKEVFKLRDLVAYAIRD